MQTTFVATLSAVKEAAAPGLVDVGFSTSIVYTMLQCRKPGVQDQSIKLHHECTYCIGSMCMKLEMRT